MRITNRTRWNTEDLRFIVGRKLARYLQGLAKAQAASARRQELSQDSAEDGGHAFGLNQAADIADAWAARPEARR